MTVVLPRAPRRPGFRRPSLRRPRVGRRQVIRFVVTLLVALCTAVLLSLVTVGGVFDRAQLWFTDGFFRTREVQPAEYSVLVGVDDPSVTALSSYGRFFGWPRTFYARVIDNLVQANARIIVFDIEFDSPAEGDQELAAAMRRANHRGNVFLTRVILPVAGLGVAPSTPGQPPVYPGLLKPLPLFLDAAPDIGHANEIPDLDGTVRKVPLYIRAEDREIPALPLVAAAKYLRRKDVLQGPISDGYAPFFGRLLPVDDASEMYVNWRGPASETGRPSAIPQISFVDVLNGTFDPAAVNGKIVFIGVTGTAFADDWWVPTAEGKKMAGVEIHAQAAETILGRKGSTRLVTEGTGTDGTTQATIQGEQGTLSANLFTAAPVSVTIGLIFGAALVMALAIYFVNPLAAVIIGLALALGYFTAAQYFFTARGVLLNMVTPPISLLLAFAALTVNRVVFEQREQRALRGLFAAYVPSDVVAELSRDPNQIRKLSGERREITVLFSDLRGFTTFSETLDPQALAHVMNRFLTAMTRVIFEHRGTVDKYIGDAVMAFWNAPQPDPRHAELACRAALQMQRALREMAADLQAEGLPPLSMRVGVNTGFAAVGNMGSELRVAYTALGDTVNLGARLEPLNNEYGTSTAISEYTLAAVGEDRFLVRFLDLVAVKGKREPVGVYELIAERPLDGHIPAETLGMLEHYQRGIAHYRARDFAAAAEAFAAALAAVPADGPSRLYLERCRDLMEAPPAADWDGVYVMKHK